jgi:hypothetical protein
MTKKIETPNSNTSIDLKELSFISNRTYNAASRKPLVSPGSIKKSRTDRAFADFHLWPDLWSINDRKQHFQVIVAKHALIEDTKWKFYHLKAKWKSSLLEAMLE